MDRLRSPLVLAVACAGSVLVATPVEAAVACSFTPGTATVSVTLEGDGAAATLDVGPGASIRVNGAACDTATTSNTDTIVVLADAPVDAEGQTATIDLAGGLFAPGASAEALGPPEIEFVIDLGDGADSFRVLGTSGRDYIRVGEDGINLTSGEDYGDGDVTFSGVEDLFIAGRAGDDAIDANGGFGAGAPFEDPVRFNGDGGRDRVRGGLADDTLDGGADHDRLYGLDGTDVLAGGSGSDGLEGGTGDDVLNGGEGGDTLIGYLGDDVLSGGPDWDTLNGGIGADLLRGGGGSDMVTYRNKAASVEVTNDDVADDGTEGEGDDVGSDVERAWGTRFDDMLSLTGAHGLIADEGDDVLIALGGDAEIRGGTGNDQITTGSGRDVILGGAGDDIVHAGGGADTLYGGNRDDRLFGGSGPDLIHDIAGADRMFGQRGADHLIASDGEEDLVDGGSNPLAGDRCESDRFDTERGCER